MLFPTIFLSLLSQLALYLSFISKNCAVAKRDIRYVLPALSEERCNYAETKERSERLSWGVVAAGIFLRRGLKRCRRVRGGMQIQNDLKKFNIFAGISALDRTLSLREIFARDVHLTIIRFELCSSSPTFYQNHP